jgi:hypothetical protein
MGIRTLYTGASTTVTTSATLIKNPAGQPAIGLVTLMGRGAFAGATLTPQIGVSNSTDGIQWVDVSGGGLAASGAVNVEIADGFYFRVILKSASATATSVDSFMALGHSTR